LIVRVEGTETVCVKARAEGRKSNAVSNEARERIFFIRRKEKGKERGKQCLPLSKVNIN